MLIGSAASSFTIKLRVPSNKQSTPRGGCVMETIAVERLAKAPIEFVGQVEAPGGGVSIILSAYELSDFCDDPEGFFALKNGVTKEEYLQWVQTEGTPRCGALNAKGKRCQNVVSGGIQMSLNRWLQEDGGFCHLHGGASSKEARAKDGA